MAEELVELLVVADGELEVVQHDTLLLVVADGVAGEFEALGGQVLEHHGKAGYRALLEVLALQKAVETSVGSGQQPIQGRTLRTLDRQCPSFNSTTPRTVSPSQYADLTNISTATFSPSLLTSYETVLC